MKPISYEIKRTMKSKFVIILILAIVGLSALLAYENASSSNSSNVPSSPEAAYGYFISNNNLTMVAYIHDGYGNPVKNVLVYFQYNGSNYRYISSSSGYANVTFPIKYSNQIQVLVNYTYTRFGNKIETSQIPYTINYQLKYSGLEIYPGIFNPQNSSNMGVLAMYVGENGSHSNSLSFIFLGTNSSKMMPETFNYTYYYNITSASMTKIFPQIQKGNMNDTFYLEVKNSRGSQVNIYSGINGGRLSTVTGLSKLSLYSPMTQDKLQNLVFSGISSILGLFIPILAIFTAYLTYGKDRTSGVLESVLKRPVTRGELISTRFLSNALAILIAGTLAMVVVDLIYYHYFSMYFSATFLIELIWTYFVEGVAFLSIVYLISHIVKSQGALLGAAIGIFVVMDLFWEVIPMAVISALGISSSSSSYVVLNIIFDYISPAGYSNLFQTLITNKMGIFGGVTINPSAYDITYAPLIIAGILWIIIPFIIAYLLAKYRD
ncbi:MAG: ABC transporter permease subunit [Thermoplasmata archaeon]